MRAHNVHINTTLTPHTQTQKKHVERKNEFAYSVSIHFESGDECACECAMHGRISRVMTQSAYAQKMLKTMLTNTQTDTREKISGKHSARPYAHRFWSHPGHAEYLWHRSVENQPGPAWSGIIVYERLRLMEREQASKWIRTSTHMHRHTIHSKYA